MLSLRLNKRVTGMWKCGCQWIISLHQSRSSDKNFGFWCQTLENAVLLDNKKLYWEFDVCLAVSNDYLLSHTAEKICLKAVLEVQLTRLLSWCFHRYSCGSCGGMIPTKTHDDDSTVTSDLFVFVERVWDQTKLQECSLDLLCGFHTLSLTIALGAASCFISKKHCR